MRTAHFLSESLLRFFQTAKTATLEQLAAALGSASRITVLRKLALLGYLSSYSHRGRFYTLRRLARFNRDGLWSHNSVWFSRFGTLVDTAEAFVNRSPAGCFVAELDAVLHVSVQDALLQLVQQRRLSRHQVSDLYLYCSADPTQSRQQLQARQAALAASADPSDEVKAGILLFYGLLNEPQRRLFAGLEALRGDSDRRIADLLGLDPHTVAKGRRELVSQQVLRGRLRQSGGGRKPTEKKPRT
jgi:hypothetical protein